MLYKHVNQLWRGEKILRPHEEDLQDNAKTNTTIELVIAHCDNDLQWMHQDVLGQIPTTRSTSVKMTILSICGNTNILPDFAEDKRIDEVEVISLPNVGGHDYAYAYFMNRYMVSYSMEESLSSVILFMKDLPRGEGDKFILPHHEGYRSVGEMLDTASRGEFVCGMKPSCDVSPFHSTNVLYSFGAPSRNNVPLTEDFNIHEYQSLGDFHSRALDWTFPNQNATYVCYGGTFGVPASRLITLSNQPRERKALGLLEEILSRESSSNATIEEDFVERTWGGLLSYPITEEQTDMIYEISDGNILLENDILGCLKSGIEFMSDICPDIRLTDDNNKGQSDDAPIVEIPKINSSLLPHEFVRRRKTVKRILKPRNRLF